MSDAGLLALQWAIPIAARLMEARYIMIGAKEQVGGCCAADGGGCIGRCAAHALAEAGMRAGRGMHQPSCLARYSTQNYWYVPITNER